MSENMKTPEENLKIFNRVAGVAGAVAVSGVLLITGTESPEFEEACVDSTAEESITADHRTDGVFYVCNYENEEIAFSFDTYDAIGALMTTLGSSLAISSLLFKRASKKDIDAITTAKQKQTNQ